MRALQKAFRKQGCKVNLSYIQLQCISTNEILQTMAWKYDSKPIEAAYTPPNSWYTEQIFFDEVEKKEVFPHTWLMVGRASEISSIGDYIAGNLLGQLPWVIVNAGTELKAFHNVCRHHAAQIVDEGKGTLSNASQRFQCPYHGWQYNMDGRLAKATHMKGCLNFKAKDHALLPMLVDRVGPWLFLRANPLGSTGSVRTDQPDMEQFFQYLELDQNTPDSLSNLVHVEKRTYSLKCNWKVFIDNYLDGGYHVPIAHPRLAQSLDMTTYTRAGFDNFFLQSSKSKAPETLSMPSSSSTFTTNEIIVSNTDNTNTTSSSLSAVDNRVSDGSKPALYLYHYPNLCVNRYGRWMDTNIVWPTGVESCIVQFDWYVTAEYAKDSAYLEACIAESHQVQLEDEWLCDRVQKGLRSPAYNMGGRYAAEVELGEYAFHQRLNRDYMKAVSKAKPY